jgi:hypothetical protein
MTTQGASTRPMHHKGGMQMLLEKILVILLALFLFGIAFRFLHTGTPGVLKGSITLLLGIFCVFALRKAPTK